MCGVAWVSAAVVCACLPSSKVASILEERLVFPGPVLTLPPSPGCAAPSCSQHHLLPPPPPPARQDPSPASVPGLSAAGFPFELLVFTVLNFIYCS